MSQTSETTYTRATRDELSKCEEVGFVSRVHLLSGEVRSVTTALKVVEEVQEEEHEIKDE